MPYQILFVDYPNASHSIMAEAVLEGLGGSRFRAHSAGVRPAGSIDARILEVLAANGYPAREARSKGLSEFGAAASPPIDFVILLAAECPVEALALLRGRRSSRGGSCPTRRRSRSGAPTRAAPSSGRSAS